MIFRRFVALSKHVPLWDVTVFTKNRNRLLEAGIARAYLTAVRCDPNVQPVLSGEHLSVMAHRSKLRPAWRVSSRSWFCRPAGASSQRRSGFPRQAAQQRNRCLNRRSRSAALLESSRTGGGKSGSKRRLWSCKMVAHIWGGSIAGVARGEFGCSRDGHGGDQRSAAVLESVPAHGLSWPGVRRALDRVQSEEYSVRTEGAHVFFGVPRRQQQCFARRLW